MKILNIIAFLVLLLGCNKNSVDKEKSTIYKNAIVKIALDKNEYVTARNSKLIITPIIEREVDQSDNDLTFTWYIDNVVVSGDKNMNYTIPNISELGIKKGLLKVIEKKTNDERSVEFSLNVMTPFGLGYYFLSEDDNKNSFLSHINTTQYSDIVFNTIAVGGIPIGSNPQMLRKEIVYKPSPNNYYELSIVTSKGDYPYIKTNTNTFTIDDKIKSNDYGINFSPTFQMLNIQGLNLFINNGEIIIYNNSIIYVNSSDGNYSWSNIIESKSRKYVYAFDKISNKYYVIIPDKNGYDYTETAPIINCPIMKNEEFAGYFCKFIRTSQELFEEQVVLLTVAVGRLNRYQINSDGSSHSFVNKRTDNISGVNPTTSVATTSNGLFYIGINNKIHKLASIDSDLELVCTLPQTEEIVKIIITDDESKLIVTSYNRNSTHPIKGSIHIIELKSNKIVSYPNTLNKCVSIIDCSGFAKL